jgi:hypothetical protein
MVTLKKIVYNIAKLIGKETDPEMLRHIQFSVLYYRTMFIRRDIERNGKFPIECVQTIAGLDTEQADKAEIYGTTLGENICRTIETIPSVVRLKAEPAFFYVGTIDRMQNYSYIDPRQVPYLEYGKFNSTMPRFTFIGNRLYFVNRDPQKVTIQAAFTDPTQLSLYLDEDGALAYSDDSEFPMPTDMIEGITKGLLDGELQIRTSDNEILNDEKPHGG